MSEVNDGERKVGCWVPWSDSEWLFLGSSGSHWVSNFSPEHGFFLSDSPQLFFPPWFNLSSILSHAIGPHSLVLCGHKIPLLWEQRLQTSSQTEFWLFETLCSLFLPCLPFHLNLFLLVSYIVLVYLNHSGTPYQPIQLLFPYAS